MCTQKVAHLEHFDLFGAILVVILKLFCTCYDMYSFRIVARNWYIVAHALLLRACSSVVYLLCMVVGMLRYVGNDSMRALFLLAPNPVFWSSALLPVCQHAMVAGMWENSGTAMGKH